MRKAGLIIAWTFAGWLIASIVGGLLIGRVVYELGWSTDTERVIVGVIVLLGIVVGATYGVHRSKSPSHMAGPAAPFVAPRPPTPEVPEREEAPASGSPACEVDQVQRLLALHRDGVLSDEEFKAARARLLDGS